MINQVLLTNNASSTLAAPLLAAATTVALAPGTGILFPSPTPGQYFPLTFIDAATQTLREIVYVTELAGDTIAVMERGQEGTTPQNWQLGDYAQLLLTAGVLMSIVDDLNDVSLDPLPIAGYLYAALPAAAGFAPGTQAFCSNGLNPNETTGHGTGCPVFVKAVAGVNTWCAIWSGVAVGS